MQDLVEGIFYVVISAYVTTSQDKFAKIYFI